MNKFEIQDSLYDLPYHYLAGFEKGKAFYLHRKINWGLDYMTYISFVAGLVKELAPNSLLDVGCGDGRLTAEVKPFVPVVRGIDLSSGAIAWARVLNPEVEYACMAVGEESGKFDVITLVEVLEHIPDDDVGRFLRETAGCIRETGSLVVSVPSMNLPVPNKHYRHYSLETLREALAEHFRIEKSWWIYRRSAAEWLIRNCLCNRLFTSNMASIRRMLWSIHERYTYHAKASNAAHIVCLAVPNAQPGNGRTP